MDGMDKACARFSYEAALERAGVVAYRRSTAHGGFACSNGVVALLGWTADELSADPGRWARAIDPDDSPRIADALTRLQPGELFSVEYRIRRADGAWRRLLDRAVSVTRDGDGLLIEGVVTDITDTVDAGLEAKESQLRLLTDSVPALLNYFDADERIIFCNRQYAEVFGVDREHAIGRFLADVLPEAAYRSTVDYRRRALAGEAVAYEAERGGRRYAVNMIPARARDARVIGVCALMVDVTELRDALTRAQAASVAKDQFLANISHEIRTPMNAVLGLSELLMRTPLQEQQRAYLEKSHRAAQLLLGLLNDVLDFSKIEAGRLTLDPHPFEIDNVIDQLADLYGDAAAEKGLEFIIDADPGLPRKLRGDALRLTQVLSNLCSNAVKFTGAGEVVLRVGGKIGTDGRLLLEAGVSDSGIGMSADQAAHIFDAFTQADGSTTRRYGGTGLGLAISRRLVIAMGGTLAVESQPGQGSHFSVSIPFPVDAGRGADAEAEAPLAGTEVCVLVTHAGHRETLLALARGLGARATAYATAAEFAARAAPVGRRAVLIADNALAGAPQIAARFASQPEGTDARRRILLICHAGECECGEVPGAVRVPRPVTRQRLLQALSSTPAPSTPEVSGEFDAVLHGARVLVVDDYPLNTEIVGTFLRQAGCEVAIAADGRAALEALASGAAFDLVLMDCQMPVMDGFEATRAIRAEPRWAAMPVVAMTANVLESDRERCFAVGMNDFVPKPVVIDALMSVLRKHLAARRGTGRPGAAPALAANATRATAAKPATVAVPALPATPAGAAVSGEGAVVPPGAPDTKALVGIDIDVAMASAMHNPVFLGRVLRMFATTQGAFAATFAAARIDTSDPAAAGRAAHTLKGAAASIGAQELRAAALALEQACKRDAPVPETDAALAAVVRELAPVMAGIARALGEPPP